MRLKKLAVWLLPSSAFPLPVLAGLPAEPEPALLCRGNLRGSIRHYLFSLALLLLGLVYQLLLLIALGVELVESRRKRIAQLLLFGNLLRLVFLNGRDIRQVLREL